MTAHIFRHFPREVDMRKRKVVHSMEELQQYVSATNGGDNLTTTVYGFEICSQAVIEANTIPQSYRTLS